MDRKYSFISDLSQQDVAGILACCGYAIREGVSLIDALEELGFEIYNVIDMETYPELCCLAFYCSLLLAPKS